MVVAPNWLGDCGDVAAGAAGAPAGASAGRPRGARAAGAGAIFPRRRERGRGRRTVGDLSEMLGGCARGRFAEAWLLPNSFRSALAPWLAGIPERIGYDTDCRGPLLTRALAGAAPDRAPASRLRRASSVARHRAGPRGAASARAGKGAGPRRVRRSMPRASIATAPWRFWRRARRSAWTKRWPPERFGALGDLLAAQRTRLRGRHRPRRGGARRGRGRRRARAAARPRRGPRSGGARRALLSLRAGRRGQRLGPDASGRRGRHSGRRLLRPDRPGTHRLRPELPPGSSTATSSAPPAT